MKISDLRVGAVFLQGESENILLSEGFNSGGDELLYLEAYTVPLRDEYIVVPVNGNEEIDDWFEGDVLSTTYHGLNCIKKTCYMCQLVSSNDKKFEIAETDLNNVFANAPPTNTKTYAEIGKELKAGDIVYFENSNIDEYLTHIHEDGETEYTEAPPYKDLVSRIDDWNRWDSPIFYEILGNVLVKETVPVILKPRTGYKGALGNINYSSLISSSKEEAKACTNVQCLKMHLTDTECELRISLLPTVSCECGSEKLGFPGHSDWCPKSKS